MNGIVVRAKQFEQRSRRSSSPGEVTSIQRFGTTPQFQHRSSAASVMSPPRGLVLARVSAGWQGLRAGMRHRHLTVLNATTWSLANPRGNRASPSELMSGSGYHALGAGGGAARRVHKLGLACRSRREAHVIFARASSEYRFRL